MDAAESVRRIMSDQKLVQLASTSEHGPRVFSAWYAFLPDRDAIVFTSNRHRHHSREWAEDARVGGTVVGAVPEGLGDQVEAVSFFGRLREVAGDELDAVYAAYAGRWPQVTSRIPLAEVQSGAVDMRFYLVEVTEWVLFSEVDFPDAPRQSVPVP